ELDYGARALELARKIGSRPWELQGLIGIVGALIYVGRWDDALASVDAAGGVGPELVSAALTELSMLTYIHVWRGNVAEARDVLDLLEASESEDIQGRAAWHLGNALVCRAEGKLADSLASAEIALASAVELGPRAPSTKEAFV